MNIKKIVTSFLLALSFVPSVGAMNPPHNNLGDTYNDIVKGVISLQRYKLNDLCPDNTISYDQLNYINLIVMQHVINKRPDINYTYGNYEDMALNLLKTFSKKECDSKLNSFYELYLTFAEILHFLSATNRDGFRIDVTKTYDMVGENLYRKSRVSFNELRDALIETLRKQIFEHL